MRKSKLLLVSWVLGAIYVVYLVVFFIGAIGDVNGSEQVGAAIAGLLVFPHALASLVAVIFNILGWSMSKKGFALTGAILYAVAMVLFPVYFFFVIIQMILSFIGYAKMNKTSKIQVD